MEKEVTIETIVKNSDELPRRERKRIYRTSNGRHIHRMNNEESDSRHEYRSGKGGAGLRLNQNKGSGRGNWYNDGEIRGEGRHINNGRRDGIGPHHEKDGCNVHPAKKTEPNDRGHRHHDGRHELKSRRRVETKLFLDKEELVKYVNNRKADNSEIEVYKIEDGLYKLVIRS